MEFFSFLMSDEGTRFCCFVPLSFFLFCCFCNTFCRLDCGSTLSVTVLNLATTSCPSSFSLCLIGIWWAYMMLFRFLVCADFHRFGYFHIFIITSSSSSTYWGTRSAVSFTASCCISSSTWCFLFFSPSELTLLIHLC